MYINTFKYTPADVDCKLCTEYVKKFGCTACGCPWMAERIEAGVVGYAEVVRQMFPHDKRLMARLEPLIRDFPGMLWQDERHRQRMEGVKIHLGHSKRRDTPAFFAVMFMFTSDEDIRPTIFGQMRPCGSVWDPAHVVFAFQGHLLRVGQLFRLLSGSDPLVRSTCDICASACHLLCNGYR